MNVKSPCSKDDISKLSKSDVLKAKTEIAFYSVNIEKKAEHGTGGFASQGTSPLGWNQRKSIC